jgi:hypothetical protein
MSPRLLFLSSSHHPSLAQLAEIELEPGLEPEYDEEERHQAAVDPVAVERDGLAAEVDRQPGPPKLLVRGRVDRRPGDGPGRRPGPFGGATDCCPRDAPASQFKSNRRSLWAASK